MSYRRSYSSSITVSGSRTVSYPASNSGGTVTVNYSETVPVYIDIDVETNPFDASILQTGLSVDELTGSVTAMNAAQCAAISDNASKITEHLVEGFYSVIKSDISMKQSENYSQLQAKIALLLELSKKTMGVHSRMEADTARLHRHYGAIFQDLNEELEKRIGELDKPAFLLGGKVKKELLVEPVTTTGAVTAEALSGIGQMAGRISVGRLKSLISSAITDISDSVKKSMDYKMKIKHILVPQKKGGMEYVPVVYCRMGRANKKQFSYYVPEMKGSDSVVKGVSLYVSDSANKWGEITTEEKGDLDREFINLVEEHFRNTGDTTEHNSRVHAEIIRLWNKSKKSITKLYQERQGQ